MNYSAFAFISGFRITLKILRADANIYYCLSGPGPCHRPPFQIAEGRVSLRFLNQGPQSLGHC